MLYFDLCSQTIITLDTNKVVSRDYIGNGAQWDPYELAVDHEISAEEWQRIYDRLDFMKIGFVRMMVNTSQFYSDGELKTSYDQHLKPLLEYCQSRDVVVMFGDWGGGVVKEDLSGYNIEVINGCVALVKLLLDEGYSCIKYYNLINEPNGDWSVTKGSYDLWSDTIKELHRVAEEAKILDRVAIVAPDAAVWNIRPIKSWITPTVERMDSIIGLYDIHTYPTKSDVNSGAYGEMLAAYRRAIPENKQIVMGEVGFKYHKKKDSLLYRENLRRAKQMVGYATPQDSQTFVYEHFYGVDMADALVQTLNAGFSGSIVWMLDDAMHRLPSGLKVWGFWNTLGEELFNDAKSEQVRPFYFAWSLLTRNIPKGSTVYTAFMEGSNSIRAAITGCNGGYMIALVNSSKEPQEVILRSDSLPLLKGFDRYNYVDGGMNLSGDHHIHPNERNLTLDLKGGYQILLPAESMVVYTTVAL